MAKLRLERYNYVGGEVINGFVDLHTHQAFLATGVWVKIEGFETSKFQEVHQEQPDANGHRHRTVHLREDHHEFFCHKINVYPHAGSVNPGVLSFPFSYQLPNDLPGAFFEEGGCWDHHTATGYLGEITYFIEAKVESAGFQQPIREEIKFVVNERLDREVAPSYAENKKSFMTAKGSLGVKISLDSNCYFPGNTVLAKMEANNTSVKNTRHVFVKVFKHVSLKAHHHSKSITTVVYQQKYPGFEPSFYGIRFLPFQIPIHLAPSTKASSRVQAHYDFYVECEIAGALNLTTHLDTTILAPQWLFSSAPPALPPLATVPNEVSFRPPWQPDGATDKCTNCSAGFSLFNRRHHCRHCGTVNCGDCTKTELRIPNLGYEELAVRVCPKCADVVRSSGGQPYQTAPEWAPVEHDEPDWQAPPPSVANGEASAPPSDFAGVAAEASAPPSEHAGSGAYPDLNK